MSVKQKTRHSGFPGTINLLVASMALAGCTTPEPLPYLDFERSPQSRQTSKLGVDAPSIPPETAVGRTPRTPAQVAGNVRQTTATPIADDGKGDITLSIEQMPLPGFIQAVYGGILKVNYSVDPAVSARTELITFRTPQPMTATRLVEVASKLLASYGVAVQDFGGLLRIVPNTSTASIQPQVRRGRALPSVPASLRPIYQYVEFEAIRVSSVLSTLRKILGTSVELVEDGGNGLLISGQPDAVQVALELIQVFDQPSLRGQRSVKISPRFWGSEEFARRLTDVLKIEGYNAASSPDGSASVIIFPVSQINSVLVFAQTEDVLNHVVAWGRELDQVSQIKAGNSLFTYAIKHADATELAKALNDLISGGAVTPAATTAAPGTPAAIAALSSANTSRRRVVVNSATNSLIFQGGTQEEYRQWLTLLADLDRPVKSALIDVLVAEVALTDNDSLGFSWQLEQLTSGSGVRTGGTITNLQFGGSGVTVNALLGGNPLRQLAISALASNSRAKVISSPKVVTRNGETASIRVGQEVPTVTSQAVTNSGGVFTGGTTVVPQTIQYRNTGVLLRVRPVIHAGDRIDVEVSQEISSAEATTTGVTTSPTIRNRNVETKLTLRDGATVMLAGMMSENNTDSNSGVPLLKDIPALGALFRNSQHTRDRTELVILITPYILNDAHDLEAATDGFQNSLGEWADSVRARVRASRAAVGRGGVEDISPAIRGLPPGDEGARKGTVEALPIEDGNSPKSAPGRSDATGKPEAAEEGRMIQIAPTEAAAPLPKKDDVPAVQGGEVSNSGKSNPSTAVPGSTKPASPESMVAPEGAKVVTDPKLLQELRRR